MVQYFKNLKVILLIFRKDCNYVGHNQILSCCCRKQCFNWRCSVQHTCIVLKLKKGSSFEFRIHFYPVKKAERKRVLNPHYKSFERDSTPYGQNVGVSEVDVFD